eukprot:1157345-Pelagomonas_calceolata.AAC.8
MLLRDRHFEKSEIQAITIQGFCVMNFQGLFEMMRLHEGTFEGQNFMPSLYFCVVIVPELWYCKHQQSTAPAAKDAGMVLTAMAVMKL